jgi:hypothetical protein
LSLAVGIVLNDRNKSAQVFAVVSHLARLITREKESLGDNRARLNLS